MRQRKQDRTKAWIAATIIMMTVFIIVLKFAVVGKADAAVMWTPEVTVSIVYDEPEIEVDDLVYRSDEPASVRYIPNEADVTLLAKLIWGEARGVKATSQKAAVAWCALNRVDSRRFPNTVEAVVKAPCQFTGYNDGNPVIAEFRLLAIDVLERWNSEKNGNGSYGRTLPRDYLFFVGDGTYNYFSKEWKSTDYYDWSLPTPYDT